MGKLRITPGPWRVSFDGTRVYSGTRAEWVVADAAPLNSEYQCANANAHLIAAAPCLYEALEAMVQATDTIRFLHQNDARDKARSALAKARGETSNA